MLDQNFTSPPPPPPSRQRHTVLRRAAQRGQPPVTSSATWDTQHVSAPAAPPGHGCERPAAAQGLPLLPLHLARELGPLRGWRTDRRGSSTSSRYLSCLRGPTAHAPTRADIGIESYPGQTPPEALLSGGEEVAEGAEGALPAATPAEPPPHSANKGPTGPRRARTPGVGGR